MPLPFLLLSLCLQAAASEASEASQVAPTTSDRDAPRDESQRNRPARPPASHPASARPPEAHELPQPRPEPMLTAGPQSPSISPAVEEPAWPWRADTLTGDWGGWRTQLQDAGLVLTATATMDLTTVMGGTPRDGFVMPYLVDMNLSMNLERLVGWHGGTVFLDFQQAGSTALTTDFVPDFWGFNSIYPFAENFTQLSQYWISQSFADGALSIKFGKIDANADFAVSYQNLLFINTAAYMPATIATDMPTYPFQAGGTEVIWKATDWLTGKFGFFDGSTNWFDPQTGEAGTNTSQRGLATYLWDNPGSYFLIGEVDATWSIGDLDGFFGAGWFEQTGPSAFGPQADVSPLPTAQGVQSPWGLYGSLSQDLFRSGGRDDPGTLTAFGQFGWSPPDRNAVHWSLAGGLEWQGMLQERPDDTLGLMVAYAHFSSDPLISPSVGEGEFVVEGFYNIQLTPWLAIQPDLQYIHQPNTDPAASIEDAWILTFRVSMTF
jgi:porin